MFGEVFKIITVILIEIFVGKIMVTKNPCLVPGDVRLFTAVYKTALKHLHDVIVFPRNGPRPHTDEMAGKIKTFFFSLKV